MRYGINRRKCAIKQIAQKFNLSKKNIYTTEKRELIKLHESEKYAELLSVYLDFI